MDFTKLSFAGNRMFWSRVAVICAIGYAWLVPVPSLVKPALLELGETVGFLLLAIAALGRIWCLSYIAGMKNELLITEGPYSVTRNPLYAFNFLGMIGLGFTIENPPLALLLACGFALFYPSVVRSEEARLKQVFGDAFAAYCAATPRWLPKWSAYHEPESLTISPCRFRMSLFNAMWFLWVFMLWEIIENFR